MHRGRSASLGALDVPWMTPPTINVTYSLLNRYEPLPSPSELPLPTHFPLPPPASASSLLHLSSYPDHARRHVYAMASEEADTTSDDEAECGHTAGVSPQIVHVAEVSRARRTAGGRPATPPRALSAATRGAGQSAPRRAAAAHPTRYVPRAAQARAHANAPAARRVRADAAAPRRAMRERHSVSSTRSSSSSSASPERSLRGTTNAAQAVHDHSNTRAKADVADHYLVQIEQLFARLRASYVGLQARHAAPQAKQQQQQQQQQQEQQPAQGRTTATTAKPAVRKALRPSPPVSSASSLPAVSSIGPASHTRRSTAATTATTTTTTTTTSTAAEHDAAQELRDELARLERQWRRLEEMRRSGSGTSSLPPSSLGVVPASAANALPEKEKVMALIRSRRAAIKSH